MIQGRCSRFVVYFAPTVLMFCTVAASVKAKTVDFEIYDQVFFKDDIFSDDVSFSKKAPSFLSCARECSNHGHCASFTYVTDDVTTNSSAKEQCLGYSRFVKRISNPGAGVRPSYTRVPENVATHKEAKQSSTLVSYATADKAVDGIAKANFDSRSCSHTNGNGQRWWQVDLAENYHVFSVTLTNRDPGHRLRSYNITVHNEDPTTAGAAAPASVCVFYQGRMPDGATENLPCVDGPATGRFVRLTATINSGAMILCEVQVMGVPA